MVRSLRKWFRKTLAIDIFLLAFFFVVGVFVKQKLGVFFQLIDGYQGQALLLEPGLANQSLDALVQFEQLVGGMNTLVSTTLFFVAIVVPIFVYFVLTFSQSLQISFIRGMVHKKYFLKTFLLGLPVLVLLFFSFDFVVGSLGEMFTSTNALYTSIFFVVLFVLLAYLWYTFACVLYAGCVRDHFSVLYKKFYIIFPLFLVYATVYLSLLALVAWVAIRYLTESFVGSEVPFLVGALVVLLVVQQFVRFVFVTRVAQAQS